MSQEIVAYKPVNLQDRLEEEQRLLEGYFYPNKYPISTHNGKPCFEHTVKFKNGRSYKLRVYVSDGYPKWLPDLVVCESPEPMPSEWIGGRHSTHTWGWQNYGLLQICHWHWAAWKEENTICQVFLKGKEWLEAYEKYRLTKKLPLELEQMELTEEEKAKEMHVHQVCMKNFFLESFANWVELIRAQNILLPLLPFGQVQPSELGNVNISGRLMIQAAETEYSIDSELQRLMNDIAKCKSAFPGCDVVVSWSFINEKLKFNIIEPIGYRIWNGILL
ncbi:uncharacterized protein LOC124453208 [Xenia sp. Carnegie-2017]|uniref:uncharacterized protein LOC124453208 n=1 Tax=Xenia sp. Carnegie-2017 TaxID=2897299 RepID=UPI001F0342EA|nr:uncharacterized protein LOC124453208 [Xenia sp. Carnegie-2017]